MIYALGTRTVQHASSCFVAPSADVIGEVLLAEAASVWFNAVLRGDNEPIEVGSSVNVQDGAVIHTDPGFPVVLEEGVTVGHQAIIHGARVGRFSLIGMQAVVMNGAQIGEYCLIGAGALITEGMQVPDGSLIVGAPAKKIKPLPEGVRELLVRSAELYAKKAQLYRSQLRVC